MSAFSVIQAITEELRSQILTTLETTPDNSFGIDGNIEKISLRSPAAAQSGSPLATLYFYHVSIDGHRRNQRPLPDPGNDNLFRRPPIPLRLRYLFTPIGDEETTNQLLVGRVIQHFYDQPSFSSLRGSPLGESEGGAPLRLLVKLEMLELEQLTQIWNAFSAPMRLTLPLLIETAAIDSAQAPKMIPRSTQVAIEYSGIRRRPG